MSRRFTDTSKWERPWFRKLAPAYRFLWLYILDKCDAAGVWYVDMETASFFVGEPLDYEVATDLFSKQIEELDKGAKWHISDFVPFQYGRLSPDCKPHKAVYDSLCKHGLQSLLKGYQKGTGTLQDKDKDKDKDKEEDKDSIRSCDLLFKSFWDQYPRKVAKDVAKRAWDKIRPNEELLRKMILSIGASKLTDQWQKNNGEFIPHPATWIGQRRWEDGESVKKEIVL